jgi:NADPH:quinone reductase-like Zn-dependent oxidoreductase
VKAIRFHEYGGADVLRVDEVPLPEPAAREVVIRVRAVAVNHLDLDLRSGTSRIDLKLPHTLGMEFAGDVTAVGSEVVSARAGDRVVALYQSGCGTCRYCVAGDDSLCPAARLLGVQAPGGYAEYVAVEATRLRSLPDRLGYSEAASFQVAMGAAWHALVGRAGLRRDDTVFVSAAGSGVGSAAIQIARHVGARVIAAATGEEKLEYARALGADVALDSRTADLAAAVRAEAGGEGVDIAIEHVGGAAFGDALECLRPNGRIVILGGHAGEVVPLDLVRLFRNQWQVIGSRRATNTELETVLDLIAQGHLNPTIDRVLPLVEAASAHRVLEERRQFGKVVLEP